MQGLSKVIFSYGRQSSVYITANRRLFSFSVLLRNGGLWTHADGISCVRNHYMPFPDSCIQSERKKKRFGSCSTFKMVLGIR